MLATPSKPKDPGKSVDKAISAAKVKFSEVFNNQKMDTDPPTKPEGNVPTGIQRYFNIVSAEKRKRSPTGVQIATTPKIPKTQDATTKNRYALLNDESENIEYRHKPPPIYIREQSSNALIKCISELVGNDKYYIVDLKKGNIRETKVQASNEVTYTQIANWLDKNGKKYYTYQLKSAKGLRVVLKGIDHNVDTNDIKIDLEQQGLKVKSVINILNRSKIPQPMFRIELEPECSKPPKGKTHPIYEIRYVLNRKITVEEPYKRTSPVQCQNCQEFGHTKSYCKLTSVCVACGECHPIKECNKNKEDPQSKKCSNCNGNHTANYRGCPVYISINRSKLHKNVKHPLQQNLPEQPATAYQYQPNFNPPTNQYTQNINAISYADVLKNNKDHTGNPQQDNTTQILMSLAANIQQLTITMQQMQSMIMKQTEILTKLIKP